MRLGSGGTELSSMRLKTMLAICLTAALEILALNLSSLTPGTELFSP